MKLISLTDTGLPVQTPLLQHQTEVGQEVIPQAPDGLLCIVTTGHPVALIDPGSGTDSRGGTGPPTEGRQGSQINLSFNDRP